MSESSFLDRTRAGYDSIAPAYAAHFADVLHADPWARALLTAFAEEVADTGPVAEFGSGPGDTTAYLAAHGLPIRGIDLSPAMVDLARRAYPDIRFDEGSMTEPDLADGSLAAVVSWYSLIHIPPAERPGVLGEFHRVLRPGGRLLLGFQAGNEVVRHNEGFGRQIALDFHRLAPDEIAAALETAGFTIDIRFERRAMRPGESTPQAALMATRSS
ncbi:class I SAM-dependent methyltransferase [Nocardia sp. NPDC024068]|uniref:class I SAM-dependent methyltransferase n=1 Tax=Nocardia sp. NPDC024068 TaxID=3157197 RepID=UPI0033ECDB7D